jgi:hypothetical protein
MGTADIRRAPMERYEAEQKTGRIRANFEENRRLIREIYDRKGYLALGCDTFEEWWTDYLQQSRTAMFYWKAACRIEDHINGDLSTRVDKQIHIPEGILRPPQKRPFLCPSGRSAQ